MLAKIRHLKRISAMTVAIKRDVIKIGLEYMIYVLWYKVAKSHMCSSHYGRVCALEHNC